MAQGLLNALQWEYVNVGVWFRQHLTDLGVDVSESASLPDSVHLHFDELQGQMLLTANQLIVEGRLSGWLARKHDDVFSILCVAPIAVRAPRYADRENMPLAQAETTLRLRDRADRKRYKELYNIPDYRLREYYKVVLDTSRKTTDELVDHVMQLLGAKHD